MDYNEIKQENDRLTAEIDAYHIFYEDFSKYDMSISNGYGLLSDMYSALIQAKKNNPNNASVLKQEQRIVNLMDIFEQMQGLNGKCQNLSLRFKNLNREVFSLRSELNSIKQAFNKEA